MNKLEERVEAIERKLGMVPKKPRYIKSSPAFTAFLEELYTKLGLNCMTQYGVKEFVIGGIAVNTSPILGPHDYVVTYDDGSIEEGPFVLGKNHEQNSTR